MNPLRVSFTRRAAFAARCNVTRGTRTAETMSFGLAFSRRIGRFAARVRSTFYVLDNL